MITTRFVPTLIALALALVSSACTGGDSPASTTTSSPPPTTEPRTTAAGPTTTTRPPAGPTTSSTPTTTAVPTTTRPLRETTSTTGPDAITETIRLVVNGRSREYVLHIPPGLDTPAPLVIDLHGLSATPAQQDLVSGMRDKADAEGFVVAQPEGGLPANAWNLLEGSGDVTFAFALIDDVSTRIAVDPDRVYATGFSQGGALASRLACDAADRIAAVASVAGSYVGWRRCEPERSVPIISFHGDADPVVPIDGFGLLPDVTEWARRWAERNGCTTSGTSQVTDDVSMRSWTGCDAGAEVVLYRVDGGGHGWPGTADPSRVGDTTDSISATDLIWDFFVSVAGSP